MTLLLLGVVISVIFVGVFISIDEPTNGPINLGDVEIREYERKDLSSINDFRENSIKGPQHIDVEEYSLAVTGLVNSELEYTYDDIINNYQSFEKVVTLHCVKGWSVTILWEGVLLKELLEDAGFDWRSEVVIFYAYDVIPHHCHF